MDSDRRIRNVEAAHIASLIELGEETGLSPWTARDYLEELRSPNSLLFRLEDPDGSTSGFIIGRFITAADSESVDAEIYNLAVVPDKQRKGNGQALFDEFKRRCVEKNVKRIWLEVRVSNERAIAFYVRNAFEIQQLRKNLYHDPSEDGYLMRRTL